MIFVVFLFSLVQITGKLVIDHKKPVAISKLKDDIIKKNIYKTIISTPLINFYLQTHSLEAEFVNIYNQDQLNEFYNKSSNEDVLIIGNFTQLLSQKYDIIKTKSYYHNPYVNRMWSKIETFSLSFKK